MSDMYREKIAFERENQITLGRLREHLAPWPDDTLVTFGEAGPGNPLIFSRTKGRGEKLVQIELWELTDEAFEAQAEDSD